MGVLVIDSEDKYSQTELGPPVVFPRLIGSSLASQSIPFQKFIWCPRFGEVHSKYSCEVTRSYLFLFTNECKDIDYIRTQAIQLRASQSSGDFASQLANKMRLH